MIKLTYKSKNRNKTTEKQALPFVQPETETLVEAVLSASQVSRAAGASAPSGESGPPPHQVIKLGIDVHLDRYVVVRQIDGGAPQPPQRFSPTQFLEWAKKQTALAQQVYSCYEAGPFGYSSSGRFAVGLLLGTGLFVPGPPQNRATSRALPGRSPDASQPPLGVTPKLTEGRQILSVATLGQV